MKKATFFCAGLILFSPLIFAFPGTEFRALGGFQFSHLSIIPPDGLANPQQSPRLAFSAGTGLCFPLLKAVSLETDILYRTKISELTRFSGTEWNDTYYRMQCVTIPLLVRVEFPVSNIRLFAIFGVQGDWIFKSRIDDNKNDVRIEPIPGLKSYDLQAVGGVGIRHGRVSVELRYEYGLLNLSKDSGLSIRSLGFEFLLAFRLF